MLKANLNDGASCKKIRDFVAARMPSAELSEESVGLFRYRLGDRSRHQSDETEVPLANIFKTLEEATSLEGELHGCAADYSLSQTSLEEVFLHFSQEADGKLKLSGGEKADSNSEVVANAFLQDISSQEETTRVVPCA